MNNNQKERIKFVEKWAEYVRTHSDKDWSTQQKVLIDSQIKGARQQLISVKDYLKIKEKVLNLR
tara:strand:- start:650 stop:841 length:192 start_codon:yes stop_codon:yes gene_type:complete